MEIIHKKLKPEIEFLKQLGFKKTGFDDKSAFWFTKKIKKSPLFEYCEVSVQEFQNKIIITVDMYDKEDSSSGFFTAIIKKYSKKELIKIIAILT
jgi:hypothetical protein